MLNLDRFGIFRISLLLALTFNTPPVCSEPTAAYTFAVVPQFKPAQLHKDWGPLLERLSNETGAKFKLVIAPSITKFEEEIRTGTLDFALTNPYQAVVAVREKGYITLLRDKKPFNGILIVSKDGPYKKIQDLDGTVLGFPSPSAFAASLYMRAKLTEEYSLKFTPRYLNNHNLVFRHVAQGHVAAGGTVSSAFNDESADMRNQLNILYKTPDMAGPPIITHPRVPENIRKKIVSAMLGMLKDEAGRNLLKDIRMPGPVEADFLKDYAPLEKLNIHKYIVPDTE